MSVQVFIDGGAGTTGLEIRERLAGRADIALVTLPEERRKDAAARAGALNAADAVILCLPDDAAREAVALIDNDRTRVIDASTAHRTAPGWVYGFPEVSGRAAVAGARRISNPGCYSTGFIALVAPLVAAGLIPAEAALACNAVSGYSGGGKAMIADYEAPGTTPPAFSTYALGLAHKHVPEMQRHCGLARPPLFAPAVVPLRSGMIVDVPLTADQIAPHATGDAMRDALRAAYAGSPIVSVVEPDGATLAVERLSGTDRLEIALFANEDRRQYRLVAMLDNLGKGAAGAAVQTLNLLFGFDETTGLRV
ncbi:MAG: N-acetyl-gamma-glutamyl-phosphate reductase [Sphingomonas fennica]